MDYAELKRKLAEKLRQDEALRGSVSKQLGTPFRSEAPGAAPCEMAVVGIHCRFPGSDSAEAYFDSLLTHQRHLSTAILARWGANAIDDIPSLAVGSIDGALDFDSKVFRISPREAEAMDPHHRVLLESTWRCIEDAGYCPADLAGSRTGVFVAMYNQDFAHLSRSQAWERESRIYLGTGNTHCLLPNRISYLFDLHGPSEIVDTACSSSLVALHRAVQAIRAGECDQAIVGGVSLLLDPERLRALQRLGILSADGRCAVFDESSSGQVMGEGLATVLLKRKASAVADRDHLYGIIRATGVNHRGQRSGGLTRPDVESQVELIDAVYPRAGLSPSDVSYIEAHGNGGNGDLTELLVFQRRFESGTIIGSAKSSIGCLEAAGGLAQLIKVLMAMVRGEMPATLGHQKPPTHPELRVGASPVLTDNCTLRELNRRPEMPFLAAIHAYGIGGVNAHVVVQQHAAADERAAVDRPVPILISGRSKAMVAQHAQALAFALRRPSGPRLDDAAYTLAVGRRHQEHRDCVLARTLEEATAGLHRLAAGTASEPKGGAVNGLQRDAHRWLGGADVNWSPYFPEARRCSLPASPLRPFTHRLPGTEPRSGDSAPPDPDATPSATVEGFVRDWLSRQCRMEAGSLGERATLADLGVDSVSYVELCAHVARELGVPLSPADLGSSATIATIADRIRARSVGAGDGGAEALERAVLSRLDALDETDVRAVTSLKARAQIFHQQLTALRRKLVPPASAELRSALAPCRGRFDAFEDARGDIWIFIDTSAGNTFDLTGLRELLRVAKALRDLADFGKTQFVYFSHIGPHFSLGGHRRAFVDAVRAGDLDSIAQIAETYKQFLQVIQALPCLTIGVAYGSAQGGGMELLMAMDCQVVWPGVKLGFPEIKSGLIAGMGGVSYVAAVAGPQRAMQLNLSGGLLNSEKALSIGLISHVSPNPFATAWELGESSARSKAAILVRKIVNQRKYPLLVADIDEWVSFVCGGGLLESEQKILDDFQIMARYLP